MLKRHGSDLGTRLLAAMVVALYASGSLSAQTSPKNPPGILLTWDSFKENSALKALQERWSEEDQAWPEHFVLPRHGKNDFSVGEFSDLCAGAYWQPIALRDQTAMTLDEIDLSRLSAHDEGRLRAAVAEAVLDGYVCGTFFTIAYGHQRAADMIAREDGVSLCLPDRFEHEASAVFVDYVRAHPEIRDRPSGDLVAILAEAMKERFAC